MVRDHNKERDKAKWDKCEKKKKRKRENRVFSGKDKPFANLQIGKLKCQKKRSPRRRTLCAILCVEVHCTCANHESSRIIFTNPS